MQNFGAQIDNIILKCMYKCKEPRIVKTTLQNNKVRGLTLLAFKTLKLRYKDIIIMALYELWTRRDSKTSPTLIWPIDFFSVLLRNN